LRDSEADANAPLDQRRFFLRWRAGLADRCAQSSPGSRFGRASQPSEQAKRAAEIENGRPIDDTTENATGRSDPSENNVRHS
jgi:hypothetical protein